MQEKVKAFLRLLGLDIRPYRPLYGTLIQRHNIRTVLDIGANTGQFARGIFREAPSVKVYSFEPVSDCFKELNGKMKAYGTQFQAYNFALGDKNEETFINRSTFTPSSSLLTVTENLKSNYPKSVESAKEKISVKRLDDVFPTLSIAENLMVKIDVQGFEAKVIAGGRQALSKAKVVILENSFVALYEDQPLFEDLYRTMKEMGFKYFGDTGKHYSKDGGTLLYEDSVFVR